MSEVEVRSENLLTRRDQISQQATSAIQARCDGAFGDIERHREFVIGQLLYLAEQENDTQIGIQVGQSVFQHFAIIQSTMF